MRLALRIRNEDFFTEIPATITRVPTFRLAIGNVRINQRQKKVIVTFIDLVEGLILGDWNWGGANPQITLDLPNEDIVEVWLDQSDEEAAELSRCIARLFGASIENATAHFCHQPGSR